MPKNTRLIAAGVLCLCAVWQGCELLEQPAAVTGPPREELPLHVAGTIGEHAVLVGGAEVAVQGYGLVIGLGNEGSSEVPPYVHKYLVKMLLREKLRSWRHGTEELVPTQILADKDTAVVLIGGAMPPGAPAGTRFDVFVSALRQTGTRNLTGGVLMPTDMHISLRGIATPGGPSRAWAKAGGPIFVNPFIEQSDKSQDPKLREGRVVGGGLVTRSRPVYLQLRRPDYAISQLLQRRINERFPGRDRVAVAKNRSSVEVKIPEEYTKDYEKFLRLVMHLPLRSSAGGGEARALQIVKAMESPEANHDELALVWEAMGRQTIPIFSKLYVSEVPKAAFYSARTGLRLQDYKAAEVLLKFAETEGSGLQVPAIKELGEHPKVTRSVFVLRKLVNDQNEVVRIAAYESLAKLGDRTAVIRSEVGEQFTLDVIKTSNPGVIYATQTGTPRIVIFGHDLAVRLPVFFNMPDDLVTINANAGDKELVVFRRLPGSSLNTPGLHVEPKVESLVELLGSQPVPDEAGNVRGLNLTYGQVVSVLYRMCKEKDIPAKFVLQPLPQLRKIFEETEPVEEAEAAG